MTSELKTLFGAYLHQDYDLQFPSVAAAIRAYRDDASRAARERALAEIDSLLTGTNSDDELYRALRERGFGFFPPRDGETSAAWLRRTRALLADVEDTEEDGDRRSPEHDPG
jgi:hypothetical protein